MTLIVIQQDRGDYTTCPRCRECRPLGDTNGCPACRTPTPR